MAARRRTAARAKALWGAGLMAMVQSSYQLARTKLEESVAIGQQIACDSHLYGLPDPGDGESRLGFNGLASDNSGGNSFDVGRDVARI